MAKGNKKPAEYLKCKYALALFVIAGVWMLTRRAPDETDVAIGDGRAPDETDVAIGDGRAHDGTDVAHGNDETQTALDSRGNWKPLNVVSVPSYEFLDTKLAKESILAKGLSRPAAKTLPKAAPSLRSAAGAAVAAGTKARWGPAEIVSYMEAHPSRAYFAHLFSKGGFRSGIEVGVADGRFSEHMLIAGKPAFWTLVEPFSNDALISRYPPAGEGELNAEQKAYRADRANQPKELAKATWHDRGLDEGTTLNIFRHFSTDDAVIEGIPKGSVDFVYLDGAHDYKNVKKELEPFWQMLRVGGVLAGHDYQNHGDKPLDCKGCEDIPRARVYTEHGAKHGKKEGGTAANMNKVVKAVQEWVNEEHPEVPLHHTMETFTRESLAADGLDYDLVITNTFNPSWYFIKET